ncbi:hypothetical protein B1218_34890, partial [Pseudomonas ogarae]
MLYQKPRPSAGRERRHFDGERSEEGVEDVRLGGVAGKAAGVGVAVLPRPEVGVATAHGGTNAGQAQGVAIGTRKAADLAVGLE